MRTFQIDATKDLPVHDQILQALLDFFYHIPGVTGCYLSGSMARLEMDQDSDIDIGVAFERPEDRETAWGQRWAWELAGWFHRFDADHVKPYFIIYIFEPGIKADINLYIEDDLPPVQGAPYSIVWDHQGVLDTWLKGLPKPGQPEPDWAPVIHEDERFWAWLFYCYGHIHRGECYHIADEFPALRDIVQKWAARLDGLAAFGTRHLEKQAFARPLFEYDLFPRPTRQSLKACMLDIIALQRILRAQISQQQGIQWKTTDQAIDKITGLIESL